MRKNRKEINKNRGRYKEYKEIKKEERIKIERKKKKHEK
jgi:hypothetical protein